MPKGQRDIGQVGASRGEDGGTEGGIRCVCVCVCVCETLNAFLRFEQVWIKYILNCILSKRIMLFFYYQSQVAWKTKTLEWFSKKYCMCIWTNVD